MFCFVFFCLYLSWFGMYWGWGVLKLLFKSILLQHSLFTSKCQMSPLPRCYPRISLTPPYQQEEEPPLSFKEGNPEMRYVWNVSKLLIRLVGKQSAKAWSGWEVELGHKTHSIPRRTLVHIGRSTPWSTSLSLSKYPLVLEASAERVLPSKNFLCRTRTGHRYT